MKVIIVEDEQSVALAGAEQCCELLQAKPNCVLGLATGSTPVKMYQHLIEHYQQGAISFLEVTSFNLDEYIGLPDNHPQSYRYFMNQHLFQHIDIRLDNTNLPNGDYNPQQTAIDYELAIKAAGGIDLQILGLGRNGHIGFNEPFSSLGSRTRIKTLMAETIRDNRRFFSKDEISPHLALTMGIGTILDSRQIMLLATGSSKAEAVKNMIEGPMAASCPASALQMHAATTIIIDRAAASKLKHTSYYIWTQQQAEKLQQTTKEPLCIV